MSRIPARRLGIVAAVVVGAALAAPSAGAHALLLSSQPSDGESLSAAPTRIVLEFTEKPDLGLSSFSVLDAAGKPADTSPPRALPRSTVELPLRGALPDGPYTVSWRVVSSVDGHLTAGAFGFGVGAPAPVGSGTVVELPRYRAPAPISVAGRWMLYAGMALLLGAAAGGLFVFRRAIPSWRWALPSAWLLASAGLVVQLAAEANRSGADLGAFLGSSRGTSLIRVGIGLGLAAGATIVVALRSSRPAFAALGATAGLAMLGQASAGHAAAGGAPAATILIQWVHLLGIGAWVGGLPWLLVSLRTEPDRDAVGRFARLAAVAVAVVAASGATRALLEVGSFGALGSTGFGRAVLTKSLLFLPLITLGALNHYRHVPRLRRDGVVRPLRRSVAIEVAIGIVILAVTGLLAELPPSKQIAAARDAARAARAAAAPKPVVVEGADFATTVRVRLEISPGTPGPNAFTVTTLDYDTRNPLTDVTRVTLRIALLERPNQAANTVVLSREGDKWTGRGGALASAGEWSIDVLVERPGSSATVKLRAEIKPPPPRITISREPGLPTIYTAQLTGVGSVQVYADPGAAGPNELHATYFDTKGSELPIAEATIRLRGPDGDALYVAARRFGPGHFVANKVLVSGNLRVQLEATARDDRPISLTLDIQIDPKK